MDITKLNDDVCNIIIGYLDCKYFVKELVFLYKPTKFYLVNKKFYELYEKYNQKCEYYHYKKLNCCTCSTDYVKNKNALIFRKLNDIKKVIKILNNSTIETDRFGYVNTIHFDNYEQVRLANPYLNYFGVISHRCCDGLGISYSTPTYNLKNKRLIIF